MLRQQRHMRAIGAPYGVLDSRTSYLASHILLVCVEQQDARRRAQQEMRGSTVKDLICGLRQGECLDVLIDQVTNLDFLLALLQHSQSVSSDEECCRALPTFADRPTFCQLCGRCVWQRRNVVHTHIAVQRRDNDGALSRIEAQRARLNILVAQAPNAQKSMIFACVVVEQAHLLVTHIVQRLVVQREWRALALQLKHN